MLINIAICLNLVFSKDKSIVDKNLIDKELLEIIDSNKDGIPELKKYYILDEKNNKILIRKELDLNMDGKIDYVYHYNRINPDKIEKIEVDHDFDGKFDEIRFYSPIDGTLIRKEYDTNFSGRADVVKRYHNGKLVRKEVDRNHDGKPDYWEYYQDNRLARTEIDSNFDGRPDKIGRTETFKVQTFDVKKIEEEMKKTPIRPETEKPKVKENQAPKKQTRPRPRTTR